MIGSLRRSPLRIAVLLAVGGCQGNQRTELVVEVGSNLAVPGELDKVEVAVTANGKKQFLPCSLIGDCKLPWDVGVVEPTAGAGNIEIVAKGYRSNSPVVDETAVLSFVEGKSMLLKLYLAAECRVDPCENTAQTCTRGGACVEKVRKPTDLTPFVPAAVGGSGGSGGAISNGGSGSGGVAGNGGGTGSGGASVSGGTSGGGGGTSGGSGGSAGSSDAGVPDVPGAQADAPGGGTDGGGGRIGGASGSGGAAGGSTSRGGAGGGDARVPDAPGAQPDAPIGGTGGGAGGVTSSGGVTSTGGGKNTGGATGLGGGTGMGGVTNTGGVSSSGGVSSTAGVSSTGGSTSSVPCTVLPVSPNASPQAKKLLCYIYQLYGNHVLSGQQESSWATSPLDDITWYTSNGMKEPAILGGDFMYAAGGSATSKTNTTARAMAYWQGGGITMIRYHQGMPTAGETHTSDCYQDAVGSFTNHCAEATPPSTGGGNDAFFTAVITSGTPENTSFVSRLDYMAYQIGVMKAANVPVILAYLHETQLNGWFWWSKGSGANFVALWKYAFNYLTGTKGLNNIIWLMPFSGLNGIAATSFSAYFPGKDYVDLSGPDYSLDSATYAKVKGAVGATMPIPLHESSNAPDPATMFPSSAPWVLFNTWAGYQKSNTASVTTAFNSPLTITRGSVPNLN